MRSSVILAIDLGTSRIKCGILGATGDFTVVHSVPAPIAHPAPGAAIQDPGDVLRICVDSLRRCANLAVAPEALVLTGQMGGIIVVDRDGTALTPWITTMDSRAQWAAHALRQDVGPRLRRLTASAPEQAPLLRWLRQTDQVAGTAATALLLAPYVATQLAQERLAAAYCERTCLGWSGLANVVAATWDDELTQAAQWTGEKLPQIVAPGTIVGSISHEIAATTGLSAGLPIIAGPGDQAASLYGLGATTPGTLVDSASTFPLLAGVSDRFFVPSNGQLEVMPGVRDGVWHPLGGLMGTGSMPTWYAETLRYATLDDLEREAEEVGESAGIVVLPYGARGVGRDGCGIFWGIGPSHRRGHLYRAILEGIAYECALVVEDLMAEGVLTEPPVLSYGGGTASPLLSRLKADVWEMPLHCLPGEELTLMGAALAAAQCQGWTISLHLPEGYVQQPDNGEIARYRRSYKEYRHLLRDVLSMTAMATATAE